MHFVIAWCEDQLAQYQLAQLCDFSRSNSLMDNNLARAMASLSSGIYVLTVREGARCHGMSSSWVPQVAGDPLMFTAAVDSAHFSNAVIARTGVFGMNVVGRRGKSLEDYFYSPLARREDNLDAVEFELSPTLQVPWLKLALVAMEGRGVDSG